MPRKHLALPAISTVSSAKQIIYEETKKSTISQYFASANCIIDCGRQTKEVVCNICGKDSQRSTVVLLQKMAKLDRNYYLTKQVIYCINSKIKMLLIYLVPFVLIIVDHEICTITYQHATCIYNYNILRFLFSFLRRYVNHVAVARKILNVARWIVLFCL